MEDQLIQKKQKIFSQSLAGKFCFVLRSSKRYIEPIGIRREIYRIFILDSSCGDFVGGGVSEPTVPTYEIDFGTHVLGFTRIGFCVMGEKLYMFECTAVCSADSDSESDSDDRPICSSVSVYAIDLSSLNSKREFNKEGLGEFKLCDSTHTISYPLAIATPDNENIALFSTREGGGESVLYNPSEKTWSAIPSLPDRCVIQYGIINKHALLILSESGYYVLDFEDHDRHWVKYDTTLLDSLTKMSGPHFLLHDYAFALTQSLMDRSPKYGQFPKPTLGEKELGLELFDKSKAGVAVVLGNNNGKITFALLETRALIGYVIPVFYDIIIQLCSIDLNESIPDHFAPVDQVKYYYKSEIIKTRKVSFLFNKEETRLFIDLFASIVSLF